MAGGVTLLDTLPPLQRLALSYAPAEKPHKSAGVFCARCPAGGNRAVFARADAGAAAARLVARTAGVGRPGAARHGTADRPTRALAERPHGACPAGRWLGRADRRGAARTRRLRSACASPGGGAGLARRGPARACCGRAHGAGLGARRPRGGADPSGRAPGGVGPCGGAGLACAAAVAGAAATRGAARAGAARHGARNRLFAVFACLGLADRIVGRASGAGGRESAGREGAR